MIVQTLVEPFTEFAFMRAALAAVCCLAVGCGPVGTILMLRRMSLMGDALSHAVLPGAAVGFLLGGFSLVAMTVGGFIAGLVVAAAAALVARTGAVKEDASLAALYLLSLALGVLLVSSKGSNVDLMHVLFGTILAVDNASLLLAAAVASLSLLALALAFRPLVVECFDPGFLKAVGGPGAAVHILFMTLVTANLVGGFRALGTLMSVGMMVLPPAAAKLWAAQTGPLMLAASLIALLSGYTGLLLSFHFDLPSGPAIILTAGLLYLLSLVVGPQGGFIARLKPKRHFTG